MRAIKTSLFKLIGSQLRHGDAGRAAFVCWVSSPPYLLLACWAVISQLVFNQNNATRLDVVALFGLFAATLCAVMALAGYSVSARKHSRLYSHCVLWTYGTLAVCACYLIGTLNLMTGMILMAAPTMGMILFPARLIGTVFISFLAALLTLSVLAAIGTIPYAPGLGTDIQLEPSKSLYFTSSMVLAAAGYAAYQATLVFALLNAWHSREQKVRRQSATDPLTGLANRREVLQYLERYLLSMQRSEDRVALLMLDIDHFKKINDSHGHQIGDQALVSVSHALRECVRNHDLVGRYGGEEFLIILPNADIRTAEDIAQRCCTAVRAIRLALGEATLPLTASVGVVSRAAQDIEDIDSFIRIADDAMYAAKEAGRNRVSCA